jgi:dihydrofolate synthase/folylpolyglutamate synthase
MKNQHSTYHALNKAHKKSSINAISFFMTTFSSPPQEEAKKLENWLKIIESYHPNEIELGLSRVKQLAHKMGLLTPKSRIILVGGTNGKGSCVAVLESLALQTSLTIGCYTSPHLLTFNERIRINGHNISDCHLNKAFDAIQDVRQSLSKQESALTFFEFTTIAALYLFKQAQCELIVLEIGLGGRLDAVNIIEPDVAIITTIAMDHTDWLGDSLDKIAQEKGAIFRERSLNLVGDLASKQLIEKNAITQSITCFLPTSIKKKWKPIIHSLDNNPYQLKTQNIALALTSFMHLMPQLCPTEKQRSFKTKNISSLLRHIHFFGRFQRIQKKPMIILDVAHNPQAAHHLQQQFKRVECVGQRIALCGLMGNKATDEYITILNDRIDQWYFVDLTHSRGESALTLLMIANHLWHSNTKKTPHRAFKCMFEACQSIQEHITQHDHLYVIGSFITVSDYLKVNPSISGVQNKKLK